jgi:pilus assembly protein CpaB
MKLKAWIPLVLALVLGLAAAKLTRDAMRRGRDEGTPADAQLVAVMTAARDLQPGQQLTAADLAESKVRPEAAPPGAFATPGALVDRVTVARVAKGQPVLDGALAPTGAASGVQALIPAGMRAITLQVNEFTGVAGLITPGCRVDVLSTLRDDAGRVSVARTIVQNVEVRAVGQQVSVAPPAPAEGDAAAAPGPAAGVVAQSVTLLVTPAQAETLQLVSMGGLPWLALRNTSDTAAAEREGTTLADLRGPGPGVARPTRPVEPARTTSDDPFAEPSVARTPRSAPPRSRTVRIIRATKEESVQVDVPEAPASTPAAAEPALPPAPPASEPEWITSNDDDEVAGE